MISQREAKRLRRRVVELERLIAGQRRVYSQEWIRGVDIGRVDVSDTIAAIIRTARRLDHAVIAVGDDTPTIRFIALPHEGTRP